MVRKKAVNKDHKFKVIENEISGREEMYKRHGSFMQTLFNATLLLLVTVAIMLTQAPDSPVKVGFMYMLIVLFYIFLFGTMFKFFQLHITAKKLKELYVRKDRQDYKKKKEGF